MPNKQSQRTKKKKSRKKEALNSQFLANTTGVIARKGHWDQWNVLQYQRTIQVKTRLLS